ncbi:hypothetical protein HFD88_006590 [Aspergillus terreus]|nr:hypothetical protein HFD88_006590 [Aspergillus terreus]
MFPPINTPTSEQSKTGAACSLCRLKKRGCDRVKPVCGPCASRGQEGDCSYTEMRVKGLRVPYVARESGDAIAQYLFVAHARPRKRRRSQRSTPVVVLDRVSPLRLESDHANGTGPQEESEESPDSSDSDSSEADASSDSYHTAIVPQEPAFSGGNISQLVMLQKAMYGQIDHIKGEEKGENGLSLSQNVLPTHEAVEPPAHDNGQRPSPRLSQRMMDRLIHTYLTREYVNLPIFDYREFQSMYKTAIRQGLSTISKSFQGILNTIFSLSGLNTKDLNDTAVEDLFNCGYRLTRNMEYSGRALERVQAYLLQTQYFHATRQPKLAWISLGHAIRDIQVLDLQRETDAQDQRRRRSQQLTRRLWHSAMIMERMLALEIGLPPQTPNPLSIPLPTHSDTDYLDTISGGEPALSGERPSLVEFLTACARLYSHVEAIMAWENELRMRAGTCAVKKLLVLDYQAFLKVDSLLHDWKSSLPSFLHHTATGDLWEDPLVRRQRNILRVRYLYLRLRLLRPLMMLGLALCTKCNCQSGGRPHVTPDELDSPDSPVAWGLVRDATIRCIATASELVRILKANEEGMLDGGPHDSHRSPIPPYWENVDYLYACGTVLHAARLCPFARRRGQDEMPLVGVFELLKRYQDMGTNGSMRDVARQYRSTLRSLTETALKPVSNGTAPVSAHAAAPVVLDEDSPPARVPDGTATDLPVHPRPIKRRRLGSNIGQQGSLGWIERLPNDLIGATE